MSCPPGLPATSRRVEGLDLLRGVAIGLVMLRHAWPSVFQGAGVVGIVVFFTLSGYLITGVLARELRERGRIDLARFYLRRACRLVPALALMLSFFALVTVILDPLDDRDQLVRSLAIAISYTADLPFAHGSAALFHLWTLAVEEQFYLVWPILLALAWARGLIRTALVGAAAICLISCIAVLAWLAPAYDLAYALPTSWAVCFVIGAAARLGVDSRPHREWVDGRPQRGSRITRTSWLAIVLLAVLSVIPLRGHATTYLIAAPAVAAATAVLLLHWSDWYRPRNRALRPLIALGTISYGVYLWNYPLALWMREWEMAGAEVVAVVGSIVAASISWRFVERPVIGWSTKRTRADAAPESIANVE